MKKCQPHFRSQHKFNTFKYKNNSTSKIAKNPVNKIAAYNHHLNDFLTANSNFSSAALNAARLHIANNCGLKVESTTVCRFGECL